MRRLTRGPAPSPAVGWDRGGSGAAAVIGCVYTTVPPTGHPGRPTLRAMGPGSAFGRPGRLRVIVERGLHPHRHQDVQRGRVFAVLDQGRGAGVCKLEQRRVAVELAGDVEEVAGVEADIERAGV